MKKLNKLLLLVLFLFSLNIVTAANVKTNGAIVLQTDFGEKDGAVSAMRGVAFGVDNNIKVFVVLEKSLIDIDEDANVLAVCKTLDSAKKVMNKEREFVKNNFKDFEEDECNFNDTYVSFSREDYGYIVISIEEKELND